MAADYDVLVYTEVGGSKLVVASGGEIEVQSGATLDIQDGATFNVDVVSITDTLTIGSDGAGHDVTFYGDTASSYLLYDADTCSLLLPGAVSKFRLGAFSGATQGSGSALSATNTAAFRVYADDGGAAIGSGSLVRAGWFRNLQTYTTGNREQESAGVQGSLVSVAGTNRHNMCGVLGSYEARTSLIVDGQAAATDTWCQAGVIGRVGAGSGVTLTVNANGILAGVAAMSNVNSGATATYTGEYCGFYVGAWATTDDFEIGLLIEDGKTTTGIDVGSCTTGLLLGGTITTGISVTSASLTDGIKISGTTPVDGLEISSACSAYGINISGACTTAGVFLSTTNKLMFHDSAMYMRASADGHLEIVSDDTITLSSPGHGSIVFGGETDWGTGSTGHDIDGSGWDWVTQTVGHVDSGALATAVAAAYHAMTVTVNQTTSTSVFGTWTELYIASGVDLGGSNNYAAVWGQVECLGSVTTPDTGNFMAAVYGNFIAPTTFTIATGVAVNAFRAKLEAGTVSTTGTARTAAFEADASSTAWDYGMWLPACGTAGINIVTGQVTGINIAGTCSTAGISMGALTTGNQAMLVTWSGTADEATAVAAGVVSVTATSTANGSTDKDLLIGYHAAVTTGTIDQANNILVGMDGYVESKHNIDSMAGGRFTAVLNDAAGTIDAGVGAVYAVCTVTGAATVSAGPVTGVWSQYDGAAAITTAETSCFFGDIDESIDIGLSLDVASAKTCTTGIYFGGAGTYTTGIDLHDQCTTGIDIGACTTVALNITGASADGIIIGGAMSDNDIEITGVAQGDGILIDYTLPLNASRALKIDVDTAVSSLNVGAVSIDYTNSASGINNMRAVEITCTMGANCNGPYALYARTGTGAYQVGGLGAAFGLEMILPSVAITTGEYHGMTIDIACTASSAIGAGKHSFIKFETWGDQTAEDAWDDGANLFFLNGMTSAAGNIVSANEQTLRINIEGTSRYLMVSQAEDVLSLTGGGATAAVTVTTSTGTASLNDIYVNSTWTSTTQWASHNGIVASVTYDPATAGSAMGDAIQGIWRIDGTVNAQTAMRGVHGWLHFDDEADYQAGAAIISAIGAEITSSSGAAASAGNICLLHLACSSGNLDLTDTSGVCTFIFVDNDAGHSVGGMDSVMHLHAWDTPYFLAMTSANNPGIMDSGTQEGEECVGHIKILWNGAAAYINVFSDNS